MLRQIIANPIKLNAKVICIGNVSVGGAGKTQIVESLALHYKQENKKIIIITKGYGSSLKKAKLVEANDTAQEIGDESKLLSEFAPVIAATKIQYALPIIETIKPEIIIFDDGLQNPNFIKDCKILVIDNKRGSGNGKIFPAGPLREGINSAVKNCDAVIMIGDEDCKDFSIIQTIVRNKKSAFKAKINLISEIKNDVKYFAFSAIGNPDKFFDTLTRNGANIVQTKLFPDHHQFSQKELSELKSTAEKHNYTLITTKKDYVKISNTENIECAKVDIIFEKNKEFIKLIDETLS
jgi:tetraacyldisaccharide 4'-kinase